MGCFIGGLVLIGTEFYVSRSRMYDSELTMEVYIRLKERKISEKLWESVYSGITARLLEKCIFPAHCLQDFFKDFENVFPAIVYNDALTSKSDFLTEPTLCPQNIDEFDLKDETSLSEYDEMEQNILNFNDLFSFNIIYPNDLKSDKGNDDNEIDMIQSSGGNENTQGSNILLKGSHDKISKVFIMRSFIMELNVKIVAWNHLVNGMLFNLVKNLYVPFGIPFDSKRYYKEGDYTRILRRPREIRHMAALPPHDQRHLWLRYQGLTPDMRQDLAKRMRMVYTGDDGQEDFILEFFSTCRIEDEMRLDVAGTLCFQLGGASERLIPDKGDLSDYWVEISSGSDFLRGGRHLKRHAEGRKSGARLSGGHFVRHLAHHFGLREIGDDWAWVALGPKRQQVAAAGAPKAAEDAPEVNEGAQADLPPLRTSWKEKKLTMLVENLRSGNFEVLEY
ncbi:hypothetical protein Tco_0824584 [Tanacetum coccineum]|uniref:Uncharacterized protein n=1 Tax=Tanacetum coccineum TaxID=301880 RepID=A0ABQ5AL57_9ASTR